jgi:hypothetical protein
MYIEKFIPPSTGLYRYDIVIPGHHSGSYAGGMVLLSL